MKSFTRVFALLAITLLGVNCWAYYEVLDNAEVLNRGQFKLTGAAQALTDSGGANLTSMIDTGIQKDFGVRGLFGFGKTDYYVGGLVKWVPIPDVDNQPAVGFNAGLEYAKWLEGYDTTIRFEPLVSKKFKIETAEVTPYASLPTGIRIRTSDTHGDSTRMPWQLVVGSQLQLEHWKNLQFMAEVGLNLDQSYSHIAAGAVFYFDTETGFHLN